MASAARRPEGQKGSCDPIGAREPRLAEYFDFPFDVIFDAANRECGDNSGTLNSFSGPRVRTARIRAAETW